MNGLIVIYERGHETIIDCDCGFMDKSFNSSRMIAASVHNNSKHNGKYKVEDRTNKE